MFSLARPDIFPTNKIGIQNAVKSLLGSKYINSAKLLKISRWWKPFRTVASWHLWKSLEQNNIIGIFQETLMPTQLDNISSSLQFFRYIDYQVLLSSLNSPYIYATLIIGGFVMFIAYASFRRHIIHTSMTGAGVGFLIGIGLLLFLEAFLIQKYVGLSSLTAFLQERNKKTVATTKVDTKPVLGKITTSLNEYISSLSPQESRALKLSLCQEVLQEVK